MRASSFVSKYWNVLLRIGHNTKMDYAQQMRLFALNAFLVISIGLTILFVTVFTMLGSYSALQGLSVLPALGFILYLNARRKLKLARVVVIYLLLALVLVLALLDRRTGTEYILIALGCCSVVVFDRITAILASFIVAFSCYAFYTWYDATYVFVADPNVPYLLLQNSLMFLCSFAVVAQSLAFRALVNKYAHGLKLAHDETQALNEELMVSNEELKRFSENLDLMVRQKSAQLQAYNDAINMNTFSVTLSHEGRFLSVNDPFVSASDYTREELIGQHYRIFNTDQFTKEQLIERYNWMIAGNTWAGELKYKGKTGSIFWIDCVVMPIRDMDGAIKEFLSLGIPITERKDLEEKNLAAAVALENIAFRTSHNVRGPLARITGLTALLKKNLVEKNEVNYVAQKLVESSTELEKSIHELTVFVNNHQKIFINHK